MENTIENLQCRMIELALEKGCLTAPEVLEISQRLDQIIIREQRLLLASVAYPERDILTVGQSFVASFEDCITNRR